MIECGPDSAMLNYWYLACEEVYQLIAISSLLNVPEIKPLVIKR
jgi:hypothetical protein